MVSFALVKDGILVAQNEAEASVPWWSFTKTIISAAALILVRDSLVALDEPLLGRAFTLRQLLGHQAGLTDYGHLPDYHSAVASNHEPWSEEEILKRTDADRLRYKPGEGWSYSNIGYLYVRRLIEDTTKEGIGSALQGLVLQPLGITRARFVVSRQELIDVRMGVATQYDPRWAYHGLLVGSLQDAAVCLDRLMTGDLLPLHLLQAMREQHLVGPPIEGRPWIHPGYGLGLMISTVVGGASMVGHTGGGPGSVTAVYHSTSATRLTCATFALGNDQGLVEREAVRMIA
jgi:CubicO group peptidase (beta-lactamase class C family)